MDVAHALNINVGELLAHAWGRVLGSFGLWIANCAIGVAGFGIFGALAYFLITSDNAFVRFLGVLLFLATLCVGYFAFCRAALLAAQGKDPDIRDVWKFHGFWVFVREGFLWLAIALGCGAAATVLLPLIGGLIVSASLMYWPFFAIDGSRGILHSVWGSLRMTHHSMRDLVRYCLLAIFMQGLLIASNVLPLIVFVVFGLSSLDRTITGIFAVVAALLWIAGTVLTVPTAMVSMATVYHRYSARAARTP